MSTTATSTDSKNARLEALKELRQNIGTDLRLLTVAEACEVLQCARSTFYLRLNDGVLHPIRIDGKVYVAYDEFAEYLRQIALDQRAKVDDALRAAKGKRRTQRKAKNAA